MRTRSHWSLGAKLLIVGAPFLLLGLAFMAVTLWVSWQLDGGAAAVQRFIDVTVRTYDARFAAAIAPAPAGPAAVPAAAGGGSLGLAAHVSAAADRRGATRAAGLPPR